MIGQTISHYKILEELGRGGMGVVYKAEDTDLDRIVALKFLSPNIASESEERARFVAEAKAAASLNHPNIATIFAIEVVDGKTFIAMECVKGRELRDIIKERENEDRRLPFATIRSYLTRIAEGLRVAHDKGIVHRDIKSSNIIITEDDNVKIMDFGLAKMSGQAQVTKTGHSLGTPSYMSPEQSRGEPLDHRTDIWSLGVVAYEMITGQLPFTGDYELAVAYSIVNEEPKPIRELRPDVPEDLRELVDRAMAKDPEMRPGSAPELAKILGESVPSRAGTPIRPHSTRRTSLSRRTLLTLTGLLVLVAWFFTSRLFKSEPTPQDLPSIAVMPFEFSGDQNWAWLASAIPELVITELNEHGKLRVLDALARARIMGSLGIKGKVVSVQQALEIARRSKSDNLVMGSLKMRGESVSIQARLLDIDRAELTAELEPVEIDHAKLYEAADNISFQLANLLSISADSDGQVAGLKTSSLDAFRYFIEGKDAALDKRHRESIEKLTTAISFDSTYIAAYYWLAYQYDEVGDYNKARQLLAHIKPHISTLSEQERLKYLAEEAKTEDRYGDYATYLEQIIRIDPSNVNAHYAYGWTQYFRFRNIDRGIEAMMKAVHLDSTYGLAYNNIGYAYLANGEPENALQMIEKYISLNPTGVDPLDSKAEMLLYTGRYEETIVVCERILSLQPDFLSTHRILIRVYMAQGRHTAAFDALVTYMKAANSLRQMSKGQTLKSEVYLQRGEFGEALAAAEQAAAMDSSNSEAQWVRGRILLQLNEREPLKQAIGQLETRLTSPGGLNNRWFLYYLQGEVALSDQAFTRAIEMFQKAIKIGPWDRSFYLVALAKAYEQSDQLQQALGTYKAALAFNPNYTKAVLGAGQTYEKLGRFPEARAEYTKLLQLSANADPGFRDIEVAKMKLATLN